MSKKLREARNKAMAKYNWSLRDLYRAMTESEENPVSIAQKDLDTAVIQAYGFKKKAPILEALLNLNYKLSDMEANGLQIQGPGIPSIVKNKSKCISGDCVSI